MLFPLTDDGEAAARLRAALGPGHARRPVAGGRGRPHRGPCCPTPGPRWDPTSTYAVVGDAIVAADLVDAGVRRGRRRRPAGARRATWSDCATAGPSTTWPRRPGRRPATAGGWWPGDFVEADEGTGIVHLAPAFGEIDRQVGRARTTSPPSTRSGPTVASSSAVAWLAGRSVRDTNGAVNDRLEATGLLLRRYPYTHSYPHCWRCGTPLIYWGKPSWYVADLGAQGRPGGREPDHRLAPRAHP